jgi:hypothetical protein
MFAVLSFLPVPNVLAFVAGVATTALFYLVVLVLTTNVDTARAKRIALALLVVILLCVFGVRAQAATTDRKKPSAPTTMAVIYDPWAAFCSTLEPYGYWYYYWGCQ